MKPAHHALLAAVAGLCFLAAPGRAAQTAEPDKSQKPAEKPAEKAPEKSTDKLAEKLVTVEVRSMPWGRVFEWLTDQTGVPVLTSHKPNGSITIFSPGKYTVPQAIDLINEGLLLQKYVLLRRENSFIVVPADEKIDPSFVQLISLEELAKRGKSEIVSVILPLDAAVAEVLAPEIKKMMGPFGEVNPLTAFNQLKLQDAAGNLTRIVDIVQKASNSDKGPAEAYSHKCVFVLASYAEEKLRIFLGDPKQEIVTRSSSSSGGPSGGGFLGGGSPFGGIPLSIFGGGGNPFGGGRDSGRDGGRDGGRDSGGSSRNPSTTTRIRIHYTTSDDRTNTVYVHGPADKIALAKNFLTKIDVESYPKAPPRAIGEPMFRTYHAANAEVQVKALTEVFKNQPTVRIAAIGASQIMVYAGPEEHITIARIMESGRPAAAVVDVVNLSLLEAARVAETLKGIFGDPSKGGPYIEADTTRNAIIVKGSAEQVKDVRVTIQAIGESPGAGSGNLRIITLNEKVSAATLAEAIHRLLPQMRANPVKLILPGNLVDPQPETKPNDAKPEPPQSKNTLPNGQSFVSLQDKNQLVDPKDKKDAKPGHDKAPIHITAFGNKLIVASEDPLALALVQELIRLLTQTPGGPGDFEVIRLRYANAVDIAKVIDEAFNGPRPTNNNSRGGGFSRGGDSSGGFPNFGGGFSSMFPQQASQGGASNPLRVERVRVVADPDTNSLLVLATPLDMLTIRNLLSRALDTGTNDSKAVIKTFVLGPLKHANAVDIANVIREVYRESMNNNPANTRTFTSPFFSSGRSAPNLNIDANGNPRGVLLSVGVDDRTNSLILACPESMFADIKKLAEQMEKAAADSTQIIKVVSVPGVDPHILQQAIDALQGRRTTPTGSSTNGGFGTSSSPFGSSIGSPFSTPFRGSSGGGGFRGSGGSSNRSFNPGPQSRGPDFFEQRVMDDPQECVLFDPQKENSLNFQHLAWMKDSFPRPALYEDNWGESDVCHVQLASAQLPPPGGEKTDPGKDDIAAPRLPLTIEALPNGVVVLQAKNQADMEAALRIIEFIRKEGAGAEVEIHLIPLRSADATSVTNTLNQLFNRVTVGPNQATQITAPRTTGGQQQPFGSFQGQNQQGTQQTQQTPQATSIVLLALPRQNAILLAAPRSRVPDIFKEINRLDQPIPPEGQLVPFPLKRASAQRVAVLVNNFYIDRYPGEQRNQHQIRITFDETSNTVFVQASPADLAEIRALIERIDSTVSSAVNDLRIVYLRNAIADELALILTRAIAEGIVAPTGASGLPPGGGAGGQQGGGGLGQGGGGLGGGLGGGFGGGGLGGGGLGGGLGGQLGGATGRQNKSFSLRFFSTQLNGGKLLEAGILDDIRITSYANINSLIIAAPPKTMELILGLIRELDVPPAARAEINIFTLKKADANQLALMLQQLYLGAQASGAGRPAGAAGVQGGGPLAGGGLGAQGTLGGGLGALGALGGGGATRPLQITLQGQPVQGAPLIDVRLSVDERTNSLIVAGSRNDLSVIEAVVSRLEDSDVPQRRNVAIRLKNAMAADVANALNDFVTKSLAVYQRGLQLTNYQEIQRNVVITAEPITNTLLINATPEYFEQLMQMVAQIDAMPPQVVIQVLVAEVDFKDNQEFGVEIGLQSPLLFQRGTYPAPGLFGSGSSTFTGSAIGPVPPGVTVSNTLNPAAFPGFNFNSTAPLGNNPVVGPGIVGYQGLSNLGVGRSSQNFPFGGFVFSAGSDSVNVLVRALRNQNRMDILSRPQIMTLDNQTALINVGQDIPIVTSNTITATGLAQQNIDRRNIGVILQVTPKITPEGRVLMRVIPEVSSIADKFYPLGTTSTGGANTGTSLNIQHLETTISAQDGETVVLGGLITKVESKTENKVPCLGDIPYLGTLFRYRTYTMDKKELIIILTPHVVRCPEDAARILAEETQRINWALGSVHKIHTSTGMEVVRPTPPLPKAPWMLSDFKHLRQGLDQPAVLPPYGLEAPLPPVLAPTAPAAPPVQPSEPGPTPRPLPRPDGRVPDGRVPDGRVPCPRQRRRCPCRR